MPRSTRILCPALAVCALMLISASDASAQTWNGFYVGGHAGYSLSIPDTNIEEGEFERTIRVEPQGANANLGAIGSSLYARDGTFEGKAITDTEGFSGGIHGGYNFQVGSFTFGVEGDYQFTNLEGNSSVLLEAEFPDGCSATPQTGCTGNVATVYNAVQAGTHELIDVPLQINSSVDNLASVRGRIGFAADNVLFYGTGGVAWSKYTATAIIPNGFGVGREGGATSWGESLNGWVAGLGAEYRAGGGLVLRAEYLHYDFGEVDFDESGSAPNAETFTGSQDIKIDQMRIGASYLIN